MYIKCRKCAACQQELANARRSRILLHSSQRKGYSCLFLTLTYENKFLPYVKKTDFSTLRFRDKFSNLDVYRDCYYDNLNRLVLTDGHPIDSVRISQDKAVCPSKINIYNHADRNRLGICYYRDAQNFIKLLRKTLIEKYEITEKLEYYICSEYGAKHYRPHFHALIWCKSTDKESYKSAVCSSWRFHDWSQHELCIQESFNAASYVSSYVSKPADMPSFFLNTSIRQKAKFSHGLATDNDLFSRSSIMSAAQKGALQYAYTRVENGVPITRNLPYPSFVIRRFFPIFRGYNDCINDGLSSIRSLYIQFGARPYVGREILGETPYSYIVLNKLYRAYIRFLGSKGHFDGNFFDYLDLYCRIHILKSQTTLSFFYQSINDSKDISTHLEHYYNANDYLYYHFRPLGKDKNPLSVYDYQLWTYGCAHTSDVQSLSLDDFLSDKTFKFPNSCNAYVSVKNKTIELERSFRKHLEKKQMNHLVLCKKSKILNI